MGNPTNDNDKENSQSSNIEENSSTGQQWKEMREERKNNDHDPARQTPQDANTGKLTNEGEEESGRENTDSVNQTNERWEEMRGETKNNDRDPEE